MRYSNGKFKILVFSDIHTPDKTPKYTRLFCRRMLKEEKPDLVVLLGDNTAGNFRGCTKEKTNKAVDEVLSLLGDTSFALVFGNHDHEGLGEMTQVQAKKYLMSLYKEKSTCLAEEGKEYLDGVGNYRIPLTDNDGKEIFSLFFMDSGTYLDGGYSSVRKSQLEWFEKEAGDLPCIVFQHIIPEEIYSCFDRRDTRKKGYVRGQCEYKGAYYKPKADMLVSGTLREGPCPGKVNFRQFDSWKKQGKVLAGVFGHDHVNDFDIVCEGIHLLNTSSPSFYTYGNNRGVRVITLYEDRPDTFDTKIIRYDDVMREGPKNPFIKRYGSELYRQKVRPIILSVAAAVIGVLLVLSKVKR